MGKDRKTLNLTAGAVAGVGVFVSLFAPMPAVQNSDSPDQIVANEVYVIDADGSNTKRLTRSGDSEFVPCWSPDGTKVAFACRDDIYVVNADGSGLTNITKSETGEALPCWSPDSSRILYLMHYEVPDYRNDFPRTIRRSDLCVMNADGTGKVRLTNDYRIEQAFSWSPDGSRIIYSSYDGEDWSQDLYVVYADGTGKVNLTDSIPREQVNAWSPDGGKIAYDSWLQEKTLNTFDRDICIMNADGTGKVRLISNGAYTWPMFTWSPDGSKIAFFSNRDGRGIYGDIYLANADGSGLVRITHLSGWIHEPQWSPDGKKIAFDCIMNSIPGSPPTEGPKIYVVNVDGSDLICLTDEGCVKPLWSPDGSKIAYTVVGCVKSLWSPDGSKIVYTPDRSIGLYVMKADGSGKTKLADVSKYWSTMQWSPDGRRILFTT